MFKKKLIIIIICLFFLLPSIYFFAPVNSFKILELNGVQHSYVQPSLSKDSFLDKTFQKQVEHKNNPFFLWNNFYLKFFNTFMYEVFKKSYSMTTEIIVGKDNYLYQQGYPISLYIDYGSDEDNKIKAANYAKNIKFVQDYLKSKNKVFVFVIEPSKAVFIQDKIPVRFIKKEGNGSYFRMYDLYMDALEKEGINLVQVPEILEKDTSNHIFFPKGALHWGNYPVYLAIQKVIEEINKNVPFKIEQIKLKEVIKDNKPSGYDADMAMALNVYNPPLDYPVEHFLISPNKKESGYKAALIGSCFFDQFVPMFKSSSSFKNYSYYSYFVFSREDFVNNKSIGIKYFDSDTNRQDIVTQIMENDIVIISLNQEVKVK